YVKGRSSRNISLNLRTCSAALLTFRRALLNALAAISPPKTKDILSILSFAYASAVRREIDQRIPVPADPSEGQHDDEHRRVGRYLQIEVDRRMNQQRDDGHRGREAHALH